MAEKARRTSRKATDTKRTTRSQPSFGLLLIGGIALLAVVLVVVLAVSNQRQTTVPGSDYSGIPGEWQARNVIGDPEAPVTVQAWEDFLCPACAAFNQRVKPQLFENYIATGKAKLAFHHFPLQQHAPGAQLAAQASECAADQDAFWPYHDRLFQGQGGGQSGFIAEWLIDYADELGLDRDQFAQCLTSQKYLAETERSVQTAIASGLNSTPSILVNGMLVENGLDYASVAAAIDAQLAAQE